jgi:hypothetical protein
MERNQTVWNSGTEEMKMTELTIVPEKMVQNRASSTSAKQRFA